MAHSTAPVRATLSLSIEELKLLHSLASAQLFRREFIDPKMPGYRVDAEELRSSKSLVARLQNLLDRYATQRSQPSA